MNISAIVSEWGALYRNQGQGTQDLMNKLLMKSETEALFPLRITQQTIMEKSVAEFSRVLQRFQKQFTPTGTPTFTPTKIPLYKLKIDVQEFPDDLEESWLGFLASEDIDRKQWPFVKWWFTQILAKAVEDMEKDEVFWGVPAAVTPGTPNAARTNLLGIRKIINDAIAASKITPIAMGAVPTTNAVNFVTYMETMYKAIDPLLKPELDFFVMSRELADLYAEGYDTKYNTNYAREGNLLKIKNSSMGIKGVLSHTGSTKIWATPSWNRQRGIKKPSNESIMRLENIDRLVKAYTDFYKGFGFWIPQYVVTNDVELT